MFPFVSSQSSAVSSLFLVFSQTVVFIEWFVCLIFVCLYDLTSSYFPFLHFFLFYEDFEEAVQYFLKAIEISKREPRYVTSLKCAWLSSLSRELNHFYVVYYLSSLILFGKCHYSTVVQLVKYVIKVRYSQ